jgi:hypothetical protein
MSAYDTYGIGWIPFGSAGEIEVHKEQIQRSTRGFLPRFGPLSSVKPYSCFGLLWVFKPRLQERLQ